MKIMALKAPTPPTPPTIDKGDAQDYSPRIDAHQFFEIPEMPFHRDQVVEGREQAENLPAEKKSDVAADNKPTPRQEVTPEDMAREAVANGSGALTKNTVTRVEDDAADTSPTTTSPAENVPVMQMPPSSNVSSDSYERGQAVLREFRDEDRRLAESSNENSTSTAAPATFQSHSNYEENHGGFFWIFTLIFVVLATFFVAKKFLFTSKPALRKSDLFEGTGDKMKPTAEKFSNAEKKSDFAKTFNAAQNSSSADKTKTAKKSAPVKTSKPADADKKTPPVKPVTLPKKDDDVKGKHFEIRV